MEDIQFYKERGNTYTIGSHMYGLNTLLSDHDELTVYFDRTDYVRVFRLHPEVKEMHGNNTKLYSLDNFARLLVKGNPNLVEVLHLEPTFSCENPRIVGKFMETFRDDKDVVHQGVARAYMGHLNGIVKEIENRGVTAKRLSHALRVVFSLEYILEEGRLFILRDSEEKRQVCLDVKTSEPAVYERAVLRLIPDLEKLYNEKVSFLPGNEKIREKVNDFFVEEMSTWR